MALKDEEKAEIKRVYRKHGITRQCEGEGCNTDVPMDSTYCKKCAEALSEKRKKKNDL